MAIYQDDLSDAERLETGQKIRSIRQQKGYPAWIVARLCDINEETLRRYEAGERWPAFDIAMKIAAVLGVKTDDLLPDGFFERHTPPSLLLEQLGELLNFPVRNLAESTKGKRSNQRSRRAVSAASNRASRKPQKARKKASPIIPARLTCVPLRPRQAPSDALPTPYSQVAA